MPSIAAIVWIGIAGLIVTMLGIIGYLIRTGFGSIKDQIAKEFKVIWEKIDFHQTQAIENKVAIAGMKATCDERHRNHKRANDEEGS